MRRSPLLFCALALSACRTTGDPASADATARAAVLVDHYVEDALKAHPDLARTSGLHDGYDGQVPEISAAAVAAEIAHAKTYLAETEGFDLAVIAEPTRLDLELTRLAAQRVVFQLETLALHQRVMSYLDLFDVTSYLVRDYAPLPARVAKMLDHVEAATARVDPALALLRPDQVRTHLETARQAMSGLREYYEGDVAQLTQPALAADPALAERYARVVPAAMTAVDRYLAWIDAHLPSATDDYALGEAHFLENIAVNEGVKYTLAELTEMAETDYRANYDAYVATARRIDAKKSVEAVAAQVASERLPTGEAVIAKARQQLDELRVFIEKEGIVTIGSDERAQVEVTPPFMRWNSAFLDPAGPFEKVPGSFYYITPPDPTWPKEVQEGYLPYEGDLLATSVHEVYPGHFVQGLQVRRAPSRAQKIFDSYAFVEGWAHYVEQMMLDAGYGNDDPRLKLGQLSNALLRNCRFLAAIGLHTGGMTVEQADALFRNKCFVDAGNAKQQAYRGTFDPGYLSYTLGKLQILALREKFQDARDETALGPFHDWLLSFGNAPVGLIGKRL